MRWEITGGWSTKIAGITLANKLSPRSSQAVNCCENAFSLGHYASESVWSFPANGLSRKRNAVGPRWTVFLRMLMTNCFSESCKWHLPGDVLSFVGTLPDVHNSFALAMPRDHFRWVKMEEGKRCLDLSSIHNISLQPGQRAGSIERASLGGEKGVEGGKSRTYWPQFLRQVSPVFFICLLRPRSIKWHLQSHSLHNCSLQYVGWQGRWKWWGNGYRRQYGQQKVGCLILVRWSSYNYEFFPFIYRI